MHSVHKYLQNGATQLPSQEAALNNWPNCKSGWHAHNGIFCVSITHFKQWALKGQWCPQWDCVKADHLKKREAVSKSGPCLGVHQFVEFRLFHSCRFYRSSDLGPQLPPRKIIDLEEAGKQEHHIHKLGALPVCSMTKEFGSHHSHSLKQEQNQTNWKPATLFRSFRELRSKGKSLSPKL